MKKMNTRILLIAVLGFTLINGCTKDPAASLFDPNYANGLQPVMTAVTPENAAYAIAGVTTLDLVGSNFTTDISKMIVYFDAVPAQILSATPTLIQVRTPNFYKDSVKVRVSVIGVEKFSEIKYINIKPSIVNADSIDFTKEEAASVAADKYGNIFVSMTSTSGLGLGVYKFGPNGTRTKYALNIGAFTSYPSMKVGPGDTVFATLVGQAGILYFDPTTVAAPKFFVRGTTNPPLKIVKDFDYDAQKNIWAGGDGLGAGIFRIDRLKNVTEFPFSGVVNAVRVYNNALYVAATIATSASPSEIVYKIPINAADTSLGTPVKYFELTAQSGYESNKITAIAFDADGVMYVGTNGTAGILVVTGQNAAPTPLYFGLIGSSVLTFQWGTGTVLYVVKLNDVSSKTPQVLLKVDMQKQSAPYYGRE
jgi:hypothetical protein